MSLDGRKLPALSSWESERLSWEWPWIYNLPLVSGLGKHGWTAVSIFLSSCLSRESCIFRLMPPSLKLTCVRPTACWSQSGGECREGVASILDWGKNGVKWGHLEELWKDDQVWDLGKNKQRRSWRGEWKNLSLSCRFLLCFPDEGQYLHTGKQSRWSTWLCLLQFYS